MKRAIVIGTAVLLLGWPCSSLADDFMLRVQTLRGEPIGGATLTLVDLKGSGRQVTGDTSDAAGKLNVSKAQVDQLCPPPPRCPPGAPCAAPPLCAPQGVLKAKGFVEVRFNPLNTPLVKLVPEKAPFAHLAQVIVAVEKTPRWKDWVKAREYSAPMAALGPDGVWRVSVQGASAPIHLPPESVMVDPVSGAVTPLSCPSQGTHLLVKAGPWYEDVATGSAFECGAQEPRCAPLLEPGATLVVASYGMNESCEGSLQVGTKDAAVPPIECVLTRCHKVK